MTETKKILLIGRSGRGKSTLANVLLNKNNNFEEVFKESSGSVSETKKIQFEQFTNNDINYSVIDTPGIGDTKMSDNEVLDIIAEAVYLAKDGLSQVLFVINGRFDQSEMATYNLLRTIIFDEQITEHTTIARTRFADFRSEKKRQEDIESMIKENQEKKVKLEKSIANKEKELATLKKSQEVILQNQIKDKETELSQLINSVKDKLKSNSFLDSKRKERNEKLEPFFKNFPADQDNFVKGLENIKQGLSKKLTQEEINNLYQVQIELNNLQTKLDNSLPDSVKGLLTEVEDLNKELKSTLSEIIESCQSRVIHVDNKPDLKIRTKSRGKLLEHLSKSCQETSYRPAKLQEISQDITDDMDKLLQSRRELEAEMTKLKTSSVSSTNSPLLKATSIIKPSTSSKPTTTQESSEISEFIPPIAIGKKIKELEDKKEKLKKDIADKEKIIRQKVLKHIFNNYKGISQELGGDIFLTNVIGEHDWENISKEFADKELVIKWLNEKFDYEQIEKLATALGKSFKPQEDTGFCAWLRDDKKLTVEEMQNLDYPRDIDELRENYTNHLERETEILGKINKKLGKEKKYILPKENFQKLIQLTFSREVAQANQARARANQAEAEAQANQARARAEANQAESRVQQYQAWTQAYQAWAEANQTEPETYQTEAQHLKINLTIEKIESFFIEVKEESEEGKVEIAVSIEHKPKK